MATTKKTPVGQNEDRGLEHHLVELLDLYESRILWHKEEIKKLRQDIKSFKHSLAIIQGDKQGALPLVEGENGKGTDIPS